MSNKSATPRILLIMAAIALLAALMVACQADNSESVASIEALTETEQVPQPSAGRTLSSGNGAPLSGYFLPPQSVQDLVNRYDVAFTGTITAIGEPVEEKPYDWDPKLDAHLQNRGLPPLRFRVTHYDLDIGEVFLDDGNLLKAPRLRLYGDHSPIRPQVGERFLFVLAANPEGKGYGVNADWNLIHLDGGPIREFNGRLPGYEGISDETSLKTAVQEAALSRVHLPSSQWPVREQWRDR